VFKKALQIAVTFSVLLACYEGYVRLFAIVAESINKNHKGPKIEFLTSRTQQDAITVAERAFGKGHWTTGQDLQIRYYSKERGWWMYAQNYKRLKDGKQLEFTPFALVWQSRDGKDLKTAVSEKAVIDLDQPLGLKPDNGPMHVVHAQLEGDVRLRDDKATPANQADDLRIGPLPYIEYDEPTLQIRSESDVVIEDRDMWINGFGMLINLRPKDEANPAASGFDGAKSAFLKKNVHVIMRNAGSSGIMPGSTNANAKAKPKPGAGTGAGDKTPLDLRCVGEMQVDLPKPRLPVRVGPPAPPLPTLVMFSRDVVVQQGKVGQTPDQLDCDTLRLVLLPTPRPAAPAPGAKPERTRPDPAAPASRAEDGSGEDDSEADSQGSLNGLALHRAEAKGHAVWLRSESQGMKALGNELIYDRFMPEAPDRTWFLGDATRKLRVEKIDYVTTGPDKGKVQSVTTIWAFNATIYDNGQGNDSATVVAQGPGLLETRPDRDKPVERKAIWQDELRMVPFTGPDKRPRKKIILTGRPVLIDPAQATLDARDQIVACLKPKPKPEGASPAAPPAPPAAAPEAVAVASSEPAPASAADSFQIEWMYALEDVHLNAPGRTMTARDRLDVEFDLLQKPAVVQVDPAPSASTPAPSASASAPAPTSESAPATTDKEKDKEKEKPAEPNISVRANRVWARILQQPGQGLSVVSSQAPGGGAPKNEAQVKEVRLRGAVVFHQDPPPDKTRGTNVTGEALDVVNLEANKSEFKVFQQDPTDPKSRSRAIVPPARVETEDFSIEGPVIGLNQKTDRAWVNGPGSLTQMTQRGLLTDKGLDNPPANGKTPAKAKGQPAPAAKQVPMKISWQASMKFFGQPTDPKKPAVAHAEFYQDVRAEMEDALLLCQEMHTYMDKTIKLEQPPREKRPAGGDELPPAEEPKPQIAWIDCYGREVGDEYRQVIAVSRKLDPETRVLLQQQQIEGEHVVYDKRTGDFFVPGPGLVYLYNREDPDGANGPPGTTPTTTANRPTVRPTAGPAEPAANTRRATAVVGRNSNLNGSAGPAGAAPKAKGANTRPKKPLPPLKLTQIVFDQQMKGRFGTGKETDKTETRWADFHGNVEVLNAQVASEKETFDFDRPPIDGVFLTAQIVRVVSVPIEGSGNNTARNFLKAWDNAHATTNENTISADKITYDSLNDLFYAYGLDGRPVLFAQQGQAGQPFSTTGGSALRYNHKTGESELIGPLAGAQVIDAKTGGRPGPIKPPKPDTTKPKAKRTPFKRQGASTTERQGYNGH
jgi:hypothetical protein